MVILCGDHIITKHILYTHMQAELGKTVDPKEEKDAIHVALAPVTLAESLSPGEHVGLNKEGKASIKNKKIGILDPFLKQKVIPAGETVWLLLYPNTITSLKHTWTHPSFKDFDKTISLSESEEKLNKFAAEVGLTLDRLLMIAGHYQEYGEYTYDNTESYKGLDWQKFWELYSEHTGKPIPADNWAPFTCSC